MYIGAGSPAGGGMSARSTTFGTTVRSSAAASGALTSMRLPSGSLT